MKKVLFFVIAASICLQASPVFSSDKAAMEETNPPAASGPLDISSITIPAETMPASTQSPTTTTAPSTESSTAQTILPPTPSEPTTALPEQPISSDTSS